MAKGRKLGKAMWARLPEELIVEILAKLPVKSLLRFRCVCKSWCNLIKSPNFIQRHLKNQCSTKNDECILIVRGLEGETKNLLSFHDYETLSSVNSSPHLEIPHLNNIGVEVCGPCNGLICVSDETNIVLCNPAMREFKLLPPSPSFLCSDGWEFCREAIGFGFDSNTNDYKVVTFVYLSERAGGNYIVQVEIYNLSSNTWRELDLESFYPQYIEGGRYGTLFNGEFHWVAGYYDDVCILSFDMSTEVFRYMKLPYSMFEEGRQRCVKVLNESIAFFSYSHPFYVPEEAFVDIWVMHQYGVEESWTKLFTVGPLTGLWCPLLLWKNECVLLDSIPLDNSNGRLVSCALDTHEMTDCDIHGYLGKLSLVVYQESLISIK